MQAAQEARAPARPARYAWYVLGVLMLANSFNFLDRQILSILIDPIKRELGVNDTAMGFLTGPAFALLYALAGIPLARVADRSSRVVLASWGIALWSALTVGSGLVRNFAQLAVARIGVGIGEATLTPCSHSMVSDLFPPQRRALALALISVGANLGIVLGFPIGGFVAEHYGWRAAFIAAGVPGLAIAALIALTVREPARGGSEQPGGTGEVPESFGTVMRFLLSRASFRWITLGASFQALYGFAFLTWGPTFLMRVHGEGQAATSLGFGLVMGIGGGLGALAGGALSDRLCARDRRWYGWLPALTALGMLPFVLLFLHVPGASVLVYLPAVFLGNFYAPIGYAVAQGVARVRMRGTAAALLLLIVNLIGLGIGPQLAGALNDLLAPRFGDSAVRWSLSAIAAANALAALLHLRGARSVRQDMEAVERERQERI